MERDSAFSCVVSSGLAGAAGVSRGFGRCRMFRTVEADKKMPSSFSWLATQMRPQLRLALVISQTREAISAGVLFVGVPEDSGSSILCSQSFQAALAHPSREPRREEGGSDEEGNSGTEDLEIVCHGALSEVREAIPAQSQGTL